jgi:hypothetical protein
MPYSLIYSTHNRDDAPQKCTSPLLVAQQHQQEFTKRGYESVRPFRILTLLSTNAIRVTNLRIGLVAVQRRSAV